HNINDLVALLYEGTYWNKNASRRVTVEVRPTLVGHVRGFFQVLRESTIPHLYQAIVELSQQVKGTHQETDEFGHLRGKRVEINQAYLLQEFRSNLKMFADLCRARGITPVLMTQPNRLSGNLDPQTWKEVQVLEDKGISLREFGELHGLFNQAIREVGAADQVLVVDLAREIPPEERYIYDPVHLTERASKLAGEIISRELAPVVKARLQARGWGSIQQPAVSSQPPGTAK
ncbi:MAG: hypothetical protein WAU47_15665, partial [Desulfobaccales bacterium]